MTYKDTIVYLFLENHFQYSDISIHPEDLALTISNWSSQIFVQSRIKSVLKHMEKEGLISSYRENKRIYYKNLKFKKPRVKFSSSEQKMISNLDDKMTFGAELEFGCNIDPDILRIMLSKLDLDVEGDGVLYLKKDVRNYKEWLFTYDSSIKVPEFENGYEIISPVLNKHSLIELKRMMLFLRRLEKHGLVKQDISCGGHIHHGGIKLHMTNTIEFMSLSQKMMNKLVSKNRVYSESRLKWYKSRPEFKTKNGATAENISCYYCRSVMKAAYYDDKNRIYYDHDKYANFNINNYKKRGSLEFRQLEATLYFKKLLAWIIIGQCVLKTARTGVEEMKYIDKLDSFFDLIGVENETREYYAYI